MSPKPEPRAKRQWHGRPNTVLAAQLTPGVRNACKATGLPNNSIVAITMFSNHPSGQPSPNATLNAYMAAGLAKTWRDPMLINPTPLFLGGVLTGWEDPYIFFDLAKKKWRVLYHEITGKPNACKSCGQPMPGITKHCGGYAESVTPDLWGDWIVSPPQRGAYTLDIDFAGFSNTTTGTGGDDAAAASPAWRRPPAAPRSSDSASAPPFDLGKSYAIYANASLTAWGGNAVLGDDGSYHLYTSACVPLRSLDRSQLGPERERLAAGSMSAGRNNNRHLSDLIPGPCVINTWERNSLVLHAVASSPLGPFTARDVALPSSHTNPQVRRARPTA